MNKVIFIITALVTLGFADPIPPPWAKEGAKKDTTIRPLPPPFSKWEAEKAAEKKDTIFIIVSDTDSENKEYYVTDPAFRSNNPPLRIVQNGTILNMTLEAKFVGTLVLFRDQNDSLIWKSKIPKSLMFEINTSDWKSGKYYGGISNYRFGIIKE